MCQNLKVSDIHWTDYKVVWRSQQFSNSDNSKSSKGYQICQHHSVLSSRSAHENTKLLKKGNRTPVFWGSISYFDYILIFREHAHRQKKNLCHYPQTFSSRTDGKRLRGKLANTGSPGKNGCWNVGCGSWHCETEILSSKLSQYPYLIDWVKVLCPTRHRIGHFGDVLPSQSFGLALKKLNPTLKSKQHKIKW